MNRKILSYIALFCLFGSMSASANAKAKRGDQAMFHQGEELPNNFYPEGYNAPAKYEIRNDNLWPSEISDVNITMSFLYWYATQDNMDLAVSADYTNALEPNKKSEILHQSCDYRPGFKAGIGCGWSDWEFRAIYTWLRQKSSSTSDAPETQSLAGTPVWNAEGFWFAQGGQMGGSSIVARKISSEWRVNIDWIDATAGRPFYQARNMIIRPAIGLRSMWIRQFLDVEAQMPSSFSNSLARQPIHSRNRSHSWGIGPMLEFSGQWLWGLGVRAEATAGGSLLYTQYTTLRHSENAALTTATLSTYRVSTSNYNSVRPAANLGLGLGWGQYFQKELFHVDLLAAYDFNVLWNQNMMYSLVQEYNNGTTSTGDLFLHGLTVTASIDF